VAKQSPKGTRWVLQALSDSALEELRERHAFQAYRLKLCETDIGKRLYANAKEVSAACQEEQRRRARKRAT
jgi:hypothetical protein